VNVALLADFGSTFTKLLAVDLDEGAVVGQAQRPTQLHGEILDSYEDAASDALSEIGGSHRVALELAASSAGGGLRMAAIGLVPALTALAAKTAALHAGARVECLLAGRLTKAHAERLRVVDPEIVLFAGGTDGGQESLVLENASVVAESLPKAHVVVACNRDVAGDVEALFRTVARSVQVVPNVLPELRSVSTEQARAAISRVFIKHVIQGKALSSSDRFGALVAMATPDAVLRAAQLQAEPDGAAERHAGVIVTDVGGATTDVYSVVPRRPLQAADVHVKGLINLPVMRTAQGDLGIRSSAPTVLEADRLELDRRLGPGVGLSEACERRRAEPAKVFPKGSERTIDEALAVSCMSRALERHLGTRSVRVGAGGPPALIVEEPDLTSCRLLDAGGGILRAAAEPRALVRESLQRLPAHSLAPRHCGIVVDRHYVLAAAGLLCERHRDVARALLRKELPEVIS